MFARRAWRRCGTVLSERKQGDGDPRMRMSEANDANHSSATMRRHQKLEAQPENGHLLLAQSTELDPENRTGR